MAVKFYANGITDGTDDTKKLAFDVSGITTGTERTITVPNASGTLALTSQLLTAMTPQTVSGTPASVDFTGIPSGVNLVILVGTQVSLASAVQMYIRVGSGSFATSGYSSSYAGITGANTCGISAAVTAAFSLGAVAAADLCELTATITRAGGNDWVCHGQLTVSGSKVNTFGGRVSLGGELDRVQLLGASGNVDGGTLRCIYG